jgi:glucosamine--fructose-6-phosphate aminotransferase (isomerizing)
MPQEKPMDEQKSGPLRTIMEQEIRDQPQALERTIRECDAEARALGNEIQRRNISYIMIAARGRSDNAGVYAQYLFQAFNGLPVAMATPSLFTFHHTPPKLANVLVLGISQSGQSEDIVEVLAEARRQGALTAAITTDPRSPLAVQADRVLQLQTGPEKAVAATKTFTTSLAVIALISASLAQDRKRRDELARLPEQAERAIVEARPIAEKKAERYRYMSRCVVISRGFCYGTAMEIALKLKELTYVTAEPYSSADFQHGPMAILEPGFPVVLVAPSGTLLPYMTDFAQGLQARAAEIIMISDSGEMLKRGTTALPVPQGVPECLLPVLTVLPGQLLALNLALAKGIDPDTPRGLRKVTVTR